LATLVSLGIDPAASTVRRFDFRLNLKHAVIEI
jgi:hypothetical protein